jgi:tetratricopeptide (TPR) repeat protein
MSAALFLLACPIAIAQHHGPVSSALGGESRGSPCSKSFADAVFQPDLQKVKWAVTGKPEALPYFSQGMTQYFGFNYEEALRNFRMAKKLDEQMAMASWGIALAAGPNINLGMDDVCHKVTEEESAAAVTKAGKQSGITQVELALIAALPLRYDYKTAGAARDAMQAYSDKLGGRWEEFKGDPNYGALYAESLIELHPWGLYDKEHIPTSPDTDKTIAVLKAAMEADPVTVGANHYWIHVIEAGPRPEDALGSANLLQVLVDASGHLVHMPSHIYLLLGKYRLAVNGNEQAAAVDVTQYQACCSGPYEKYSANPRCPQLYYGHYLSHNYFFGSVSATFSGQSKKAVKMACDTRAHAQSFLVNEPGLQRYMTAPLMTLVANRNWTAVTSYPAPPDDCYNQPPFKQAPSCDILRAMWLWAQGMAMASTGNPDVAYEQYTAMTTLMDENQTALSQPGTWGNNSAWNVLIIGQSMLHASYLWARGQGNDAIEDLRKAVAFEDKLTYDEPPQWFSPVCEVLGGAYLQRGYNFEEAKKQFDDELKRHPASGRALYGKLRALQELGDANADAAKREFCKAWEYADYRMSDQDLWENSPTRSNHDPGITCPVTPGSTPRPDRPSRDRCVTPPWPPPLLACPAEESRCFTLSGGVGICRP